MLSGESSVGRYPLKCMEIMTRIAKRVELSGGMGFHKEAVMDSKHSSMVQSAVELAIFVRAVD